jgi:hypothetical protein
VAPGIGAYTEDFSTGGTDYKGCIMSSKGPDAIADPLISTCGGDPDSGKRFKLKSVVLNQPMDIAFNLTNTGDTNLYNIYGKFTNDTGQNATGFTVQIGTGIGANFRELPNVTIVGGTTQLGKYPGGLFGGSPAEGLPFFDVESARFSATDATTSSVHTRTTDVMPAQYTDLFPAGWLPLSGVPDAWFWDNDGMPWTDDKLLAYTTDGTNWFTFEKKWYLDPANPGAELVAADIATVLADFDDGDTVDLTTIPLNLNPLVTPFVNINTLTTWLNTEAGLVGPAAYKTQDVVNALLNYLKLEQQPVDPATKGWTNNEPTVTDSASGDALVATWDTSLGDDGLYVLAAGYTNITGAVETSPGVWTVTSDQMQDFVEALGSTYVAVAGYSQGVIEDLSNVNVYSAVQVAGGVTGPLTMRVWVTDAAAVVPAPLPPATSSSGGGGCAIGGDGRFDPTLPALAAAGLVFFGLRRFKSGK